MTRIEFTEASEGNVNVGNDTAALTVTNKGEYLMQKRVLVFGVPLAMMKVDQE